MDIKEGDIASPGQKGIRVVSFDRLKAEASLGENYLGKVQTGDPVTLVFPELGDSIQAKLSYVSKAVDPLSRAFTVEVRLGANKNLHPNMSCRMRIANYQNGTAITVPIRVIQKTAEGDMLYVVENNKAVARIVTTGRTSSGEVEVVSGLNAGDIVVAEGFEELSNGSPVAVK